MGWYQECSKPLSDSKVEWPKFLNNTKQRPLYSFVILDRMSGKSQIVMILSYWPLKTFYASLWLLRTLDSLEVTISNKKIGFTSLWNRVSKPTWWPTMIIENDQQYILENPKCFWLNKPRSFHDTQNGGIDWLSIILGFLETSSKITLVIIGWNKIKYAFNPQGNWFSHITPKERWGAWILQDQVFSFQDWPAAKNLC